MNTKKDLYMGRVWIKYLVLLLAVLSCGSAPGQVLFDNGLDVSAGTAAYADTGYNFYESGDVFTAALSGTANYVEFVGIYVSKPDVPPLDSFVLNLNSVVSGAPDALIGTSTLSDLTRTAIGNTTTGFTLYDYTGYLDSPFAVDSTLSYYLGFTDTTNPYEEFALTSTTTPGPATAEYSYSASTGFYNTPNLSLAFRLSAESTPEPSTGALVVAGLLVLWQRLRRQT